MSENLNNSNYFLIKNIVNKLKSKGIKKFPDDFLSNYTTKQEIIPNKILFVSTELFGQYEIRTTDDEPFKIVDDLTLAKYYVYSSTQKKTTIDIPNNIDHIKEIIKNYEHYFDQLVKEINSELSTEIIKVDKLKIINQIITSINLIRL